MKERPILFNAEMVKAILSGRKTQTRRMVKFPLRDVNMGCELAGNELAGEVKAGDYRNCPLGQPGDQLWVRETWGVVSHAFDDDGVMIDWVPDRPATPIHELPFGNGYYSGHAIYAADGSFTWGDDDGYEDGRSCWKPSIHMPRLASRIDLLITGVRVERLNDISQEDAKSEGCCYGRGGGAPDLAVSPADHFPTLWESIYGIKSWAANPWVWVLEFEHVAPAGEQP